MESLKNNHPSYDRYYKDYEDRTEYRIDNFELINLDGGSNLNFRTYLNQLNSHIPNGNNHMWSISCSNPQSCDTVDNSNSAHICINPKSCIDNTLSNWYSDAGSDNNVKVLNAFINSIKMARRDSTAINEGAPTTVYTTTSIGTILEDLIIKYKHFIQKQIDSLANGIFTFETEGKSLQNISTEDMIIQLHKKPSIDKVFYAEITPLRFLAY